MEEFEDVTVKVPRARLGEFYTWFGRWLAEADAPGEPATVQPWDPETDVQLAADLWTTFPERAKALFGLLMAYPSAQLSGDDLARELDIPNGKYGVAGVLAWPGRRLRRVGRPLPIDVEASPGGGSYYSMSPRLARLFSEAKERAARDEVGDRPPPD